MRLKCWRRRDLNGFKKIKIRYRRIKESMMVLRTRQGNRRQLFQIIRVSSFNNLKRAWDLCKVIDYFSHPFLYPRHLCRRVYSFHLSIRPFVCSLVQDILRQSFSVKVSLVVYISYTNGQKLFIFGPKVPYRVYFVSMSSSPSVHARGWGVGLEIKI